jgi:Dual specificity phosphatase, catalytic domain
VGRHDAALCPLKSRGHGARRSNVCTFHCEKKRAILEWSRALRYYLAVVSETATRLSEMGMKRVWRWLPIVVVGVVVLAGVGAWFWLRWLEGTYDRHYVQVEKGLYIGSAADEPPPGTQAVVNLCGRQDPYQVQAVLWEPVFEGGKEPDLDWLRRVVAFISEQRGTGQTTYVHCLAGMNRSGAAVTAYLMHEHGWGRDEALAFLQCRRSQVQPNPALMRLLGEWEQTLKAEPSSKADGGRDPGP